VLDLAGGQLAHGAWITAFACMAGLVLIQPFLVMRLVGRPLIYD